MTREVNENETVNAGDAVEATDADGDVLTYTLSGGADMGSFGIVKESGQITVGSDTKLNYEGEQTSYEVEVTATDPFGGSDSTMVTITVANVNEMPDFEADDPDDYEENGTGPVATFTATDPEGADVEWSISGLDAADFSIDKATGVLSFSKSPNFEMPSDRDREAVTEDLTADPPVVVGVEAEEPVDNEYLLMVTATEVRPEGSDEKAESTSLAIAVKVTNVEEAGTITLTRLQSRVEAIGQTASLDDPDRDTGNAGETTITTGVTWLWSVPKVSRPVTDDDDHWTPAGGATGAANYAPNAADAGEILRVKVSYADGEGADKKTYALTAYSVAETRTDNKNPAFGAQVTTGFTIPEDTAVGTFVGTVKASDVDSSDILSHVLTAQGDNVDKFEIDIATGVIKVAAALDFEGTGSGVYTVTVTAYDPSNGMGTTGVTITTTNVNEAPNKPTSSTDAVTMFAEDRAVDPDELDTFLGTYTATPVGCGRHGYSVARW